MVRNFTRVITNDPFRDEYLFAVDVGSPIKRVMEDMPPIGAVKDGSDGLHQSLQVVRRVATHVKPGQMRGIIEYEWIATE